MPTMRRGTAPGARGEEDFEAAAKAGVMESRRGSARATPAPRRNVRRPSARPVTTRDTDMIFLLCLGIYRDRPGTERRSGVACHPEHQAEDHDGNQRESD